MVHSVCVSEIGDVFEESNEEIFILQTKFGANWEEIYPCDINNGNKGNAILLDASDVQREVNFLGGRQVTYEESGNGTRDEFIWFRALVQEERKRKVKLGLCSVVCEGLRSLQDSRGWKENCEAYKVEESRSDSGWKELASNVLVESFVLKSLDGSLMLNCNFMYLHQIRSKWNE